MLRCSYTRPAMSRLFRDVDGEPLGSRGSVVCIGAFDGLHLGHRALVGHVVARARARALDAAVVSFEPLPREFFAGDRAPPRLSLPRMRHAELAGLGVDLLGLLRFNAGFAAMGAREFVERVLVRRLAAREVWVGPDFRFGRGREGDVATLAALGREFGFSVGAVPVVRVDGERVSATRIRELLAQGDLVGAARLLGRPYALAGRVVRGRQLGRELRYPTANLRLAGKRPPMSGIFAVRVRGVADAPMPAVASLGTRPTVDDGAEPWLEVHLFDFDGDLYGRRIEVEFVAKLRDEEKFPDLPTLVAQMDRDAERARQALRTDNNERMSA